MATPSEYPDELRERATPMVVEARRRRAANSGALARIGQLLGINLETLPNWVIQAEVDEGCRSGTPTNDVPQTDVLEKQVRELRRANPTLRSTSTFCTVEQLPIQQVTAYTDSHKGEFGVESIWKVLQAAPSTYYAAKTEPPLARSFLETGGFTPRLHSGY